MKAILAASGLLFAPDVFLAPRPPAEFVGNRAAPIAVYYADPATVNEVCRGLINQSNDPARRVPSDWIVYACTNTASRRSLMPDPCLAQYATESFATLACHEKGHANGWGWEYP